MNRFEMFLAMLEGRQVTIEGPHLTLKGIIRGISMEDGSGHCFIVTLQEVGELETIEVFVRG